jgi:hypothetical protein
MEFSQNFKNWFGSSKVIDDKGNPLAVYHGTKADFDTFDLNKAGSNNDPGMWGTGFYFSPQIRMSKGYGNKFKRVYLSLQNPLIVGDDHGDIPSELNTVLNIPWSPNFHLTKETANAIRSNIISMGYDGVMQYSNGWKYPAQIVAFYPNQVKSAIGNKGTYNKEDERITESKLYYPKIGTIFNNWNAIPDPECADDAQCILESHHLIDKNILWEFCYMNPIELANQASVFSGWSIEQIMSFAGEELIEEIKERGIDHPVVIYKDDLEGNHRLSAAIYLDLRIIPVYRGFLSDINEEQKEELFTFITESKMIRNDQTASKFDINELSEILFAMLLTLHLLGPTNEVKRYCINSLQFPKFDHIFLSSTDLANVISTLRNAKEYLQKPNIDIPVIELKRYLRGTISGNNIASFSRAFFFKMQTRLKIKDANLLILRREIVDSDSIRNKTRLGDQLYQYLRKYNNCDLLVILQILMDES